MKINTTKELDNGVCVTSVGTSDFSYNDLELMSDFAEPVINLGGVFGTGTPAEVTGSADMSAGYDFSIATPSFSLAYRSGPAYTVVLTKACTDAEEVAEHIQEKIDAVIGNNIILVGVDAGKIVFSSHRTGAYISFTLAAGTPDALIILGILAGTYSGAGDDDFELPDRLVKIKNDSPFVEKFDSRDYGLDRAAYMGDTWELFIIARIKSAMDELRGNTDTFSGQSMITY